MIMVYQVPHPHFYDTRREGSRTEFSSGDHKPGNSERAVLTSEGAAKKRGCGDREERKRPGNAELMCAGFMIPYLVSLSDLTKTVSDPCLCFLNEEWNSLGTFY